MADKKANDWIFPGCPRPPKWALDWPALLRRFSWLRGMAGVPQSAVYHAEGDVLIHTALVVQALIALDEWRDLAPAARSVLFAAALLHDVSKPACTVIEADGHISSRGHARKGELDSRYLLWSGEDFDQLAPLLQREQIARLVKWHGLPLWFLEREAPERELIAASQSIALAWVALLSEADVRGRICADQQDLLDRVALFREMARDLGCYDQPREFPSAHSRYLFFQRPDRDVNYHAFDDTVCEVVLMAGLPGAGKDTWIQANLPEWPVISLDDLRRELKIDPTENQARVVELARERAREFLRQGQSFIWNATSITRNRRRSLIDLFAGYKARVRIVYLDAPLDVLLRRNAQRQATVPEQVLVNLMRKLDVPDLTEAHQVEWHATG